MGVDKSDVLKKMREAEAIYVLMSDCTRMPFVVCDPETYDDQVLIFFSEEEAMKGGQEFLKEGNPLKIFNIENKYMLPFYSSLFPAGVNGMWVGKDTEEEIKQALSAVGKNSPEDELKLQLTELVRRPEQKPGEEPIENPSFQITAMYFMQKARKQKEMKITEDMKDLQEELMAHYQDATFITAVTEEKKMPVLNKNDGQVLLPLFTDVQEFLKFQNNHSDTRYSMGVLEAVKVPEAMGDEMTGVVVNPFGVDLQLNIVRPQNQN